MNLELLESYGQNYPEEHDGNLDSSSDRGFHAFFDLILSKISEPQGEVTVYK